MMAVALREPCGGMAIMSAPPAPLVPRELIGEPIVALIVLWTGAPEGARDGIAALEVPGDPVVDIVRPTTYGALQQVMDQGAPAGHRDYFKGGFMAGLPDDAVEAIVALGSDLRAPLTQIICAPLGAGTAYADVV